MENIMSEKLKHMPELLTTQHLVELGLFNNKDDAYLCRKRGNTPPFVQVSPRHKVLYPKDLLIKWIEEHVHYK
jgi:hypothetical protein